MILGLHHVAIATTDIDRMRRFYCDLIGYRVVAEGGWEAGDPRRDAFTQFGDSAARYLVLRLGDTYLELFRYSSPCHAPGDPDRPVSKPGITHLCVAVRDIDHEYARLRKAGVRFHADPGPRGAALRATYGRDPDGNVFELVEFADADHPFAYRD